MPVLASIKRSLNSYRFGLAARPHRAELVKMIDRRVGSVFDAEDIVQNALLRAFVKWQENGPDHFTAFPFWLRLVAFNEMKRHFQTLPAANDSDAFDVELHAEMMGTAPSSLDLALAEERAAALVRAVDGLPDDWRHVLIMRELELMEVAEVAELLGISEGNVRWRAHKARAAVLREAET